MTVEDRFMGYVQKQPNGCWLWTGNKSHGYGYFRIEGKRAIAHRVSWFLEYGEWPDKSLQLDHLCRVRSCVRPSHLELVTCRENLLRAPTRQAENARKTHCIRGHEFTPENTLHFKPGRTCAACQRLRAEKHRRKTGSRPLASVIAARALACKHGHPFDEQNTHVDKRGKRHCRTCDRLNKRRDATQKRREGKSA